MTPRERYQALLEGGEFDIHPRLPILMQFAAEHIRSHYGAFAADHRVLVEANIRCAEDFDFDQLSCISDPYRETAGFGAEIRFHQDAVPECVRPPLEEEDDLDAVEVPDPLESERMRDRVDAVRLFRERTGDRYSVLGWVEGPAALAADLRGVSDFMMDLLEEPEWCAALMDIATEASVRFARAQIEAGADTIGVGDAVCSQISAATHAQLIWPRQMRLIQAIKDAGARARLHICGQTKHLWPRLVELPIDILDCDHMVDMRAAAATFPENLAFAGNLDPAADLRFGSPDEIVEKTRACRRALGRRWLVSAGCEIPSGTPNENLKALCRPLVPE